jgi:hypothetical protein
MYDINRREQFETVGDLKRLLADIPDDTDLYICGSNGWFHIEEDESIVCLDCDDLEDCYEEG